MRRAGEVVRTAQGLAVVRAADGDHPEVGTAVLAQDLEAVGEVVDVFGPVARPYLAVRTDGPPAALLGDRLYVR